MAENKHEKQTPSFSPGEDITPAKEENKLSSTGKRSKIEVEALEAMLKKRKKQKPD